ncbi:MAG: LLM class flavin-dependent oxidoreductase [Gammaproteobacteria bacterium]|nr:LLM class flavin-dependent oxidoreductase [Gammaproteobacteria bacterium]NND37703.1 LLM class flavin-dependent oxidoreductase [Gammaproteobacteria bacterium]
MRIDLILMPQGSPERWAELAQLAESYGISAIWVSNMHDGRDPFVNFVDAARATSKIKMGPVAVSPYELHPLKMGNALLTLNEIAKGRAQIGISAGDGGTAYAMGFKAERRLRAVRECVEIIDAMATGEMVQYFGEMYEIKWYHSSWVTQPKPGVYVCAGGPQMLRSAAKYSEGIFLGDHPPDHVAEVRAVIDPIIEEYNNPHKDTFCLRNFWAWHVKEDPEEALAECRMWLAARVTPWPAYHEYHTGILPDEEMQMVYDNTDALNRAFYGQDPNIPEVPREILDKLCRRCTSSSSLDEIDVEIDRMKKFRDAGLTDIALRVYENPEWAIKIIGERVIPALA